MLNLIAKDFKLLFASGKSKREQILSIIFSIVLGMIFITVETYLFVKIINKIKIYPNAPKAFFTIFLAIVSILMICNATKTAKQLLFNDLDITQLTPYPIDNSKKVLSKMLFLFIIQYFTNLVFTLPLFIAYGILMERTLLHYYLALFYPVLAFLFEGGIGLILVYPYKLIKDFLSKHHLVEFIVTLLFLVILVVLYGLVLDLFKELVSSNNLDIIFNKDVLDVITNIGNNLVPINFLANIFIDRYSKSLLSYVTIVIGIFILGLALAIYFYNAAIKNKGVKKAISKKHKLKLRSPTQALIRKECFLLFGNSDFISSFTGLVIIQPILTYLIISTMNVIFTSGSLAYYFAMIPLFVPSLDILLIALIMLIIASGANSYISVEGDSLRIIKTIPVSAKKQIAIKLMIPFICSFASLLISLIVLLATRKITLLVGALSLVISLILLINSSLVSLFEELHIRKNAPRSNLLSSLVSYLVPFVCFIISVLFSFFKVSNYITLVVVMLLMIAITIPCVYHLPKRIENNFLALEVVN